jgi:subtilisin family serine protease
MMCVVSAALATSAPASDAHAAEAVPGEILVRFEPGVSAHEHADARERAGVSAKRDLLLPRLQLVRTVADTPVSRALAALNRDPRVSYAEPNWLRRLQATPNDPLFPQQWNLDNTGQTVEGTPGADISAPAAWDSATGSRNVKVAVIDGGIDYFHPDLAANIWHNPGEAIAGEERNGLDDDHNGLVDDLYGWDFMSDDAGPVDEPDGHGTAVAGAIGAVGNNGLGVAGVNWAVTLIPLKVCRDTCPDSTVAEAMVYAGRIGADVANVSLGGSMFSFAMRDAIAGAPNTLFVPGAGNSRSDNDTEPLYPCAYDLANVVCVAATDDRDNLVSVPGSWGSSYGATSVDLGAPGLDVRVPNIGYRVLFSDDFEGTQAKWDYAQVASPLEARWSRTLQAGGFGLEESPYAFYPNDFTSQVTLNDRIDLAGRDGCFVTVEGVFDTEPAKDYLHVQAATAHDGPYTELTRVSGRSSAPVNASLDQFSGRAIYLRLKFTSDATNRAEGARVEKVLVRCDDPAASYGYESGTSLAAPQVSGAAALVKSAMPGLSVAGLRERILGAVDPLVSLAGKTVTGGRLNVARALTDGLVAPVAVIDSGPPSLSDSAAASFGFSASKLGATFECRLDGAVFAACVSPKQYPGLADGAHTFQVRAKDAAGNVGAVAEASWMIDTAAPTAAITDQPPSSTNSRVASFGFASSEAGATFECRLDGAAFAACVSPKQYAGLEDGEHTFQVRAIDAAGNVGPATEATWTIDSTAPVVTITDGPGESTTSRAASFTFASSEPGGAFECSLDGSAFAACASPAAYDGLEHGSHTFAARARDAAGNWSATPATRAWTITDPPTSTTGSGTGSEVGEPVAVAPRAPAIGDPQPQAFDLPRLALSIPPQTIGRALRRGLVSFASARAACPCRLTQTLRVDAGLARRVGLVGQRSASAPAVARVTTTLPAARRVRAVLRLSRRTRTRLVGVARVQGWLDAKLTDRYGRPATARQRVRLSR